MSEPACERASEAPVLCAEREGGGAGRDALACAPPWVRARPRARRGPDPGRTRLPCPLRVCAARRRRRLRGARGRAVQAAHALVWPVHQPLTGLPRVARILFFIKVSETAQMKKAPDIYFRMAPCPRGTSFPARARPCPRPLARSSPPALARRCLRALTVAAPAGPGGAAGGDPRLGGPHRRLAVSPQHHQPTPPHPTPPHSGERGRLRRHR